MIQVGNVWTYIFAPEINNKVTGKWIYKGSSDFFREIAPQLDELANEGILNMAKFANKHTKCDPCPYIKNSVLCVYTLIPQEEGPRLAIKEKLGLWTEVYKTEKQTKLEWSPGGVLYEEYIKYWRNKRGTL